MKKVVVTGGAGFIGSHLVDELINKGVEVHIFDDMSMGSEDNINPKAKFHKIDISTMGPRTLAKFMVGVDTVFHVASRTRVQPSIKNPSLYHRVNVTGTLNMLIASVKVGVKRFVYRASSSAYGESDVMPLDESMPTNPMSPYGLSKLMGEEYCKLFHSQYGIETVNLRYFNVYGPGEEHKGKMSSVAYQAWKKGSFKLFDGKPQRDFVYIDDVVNATLTPIFKKCRSGIYHVGTGEARTFEDVLTLMDIPFEYWNKNNTPKGYQYHTQAEPKMMLPTWRPMKLEEGIKKYKQYLKGR